MKKTLIAALIITLSGCAAGGKKTEADIYQEAVTAVSSGTGRAQVDLVTVDIPSHGAIADLAVIGLGGGANATYLRELLTQLKTTSNQAVLIQGSSASLNYAVISNAVKDMNLSGVHIIYSGKSAKQDQIAQAIKESGASYYFIDKQK
ncbi:MAG TPA: hypothetical protein VJY57_05570 [Thiopseudomonas sp.]|nr:hypothetical protein [Thiopseudomonas sp.]